MLGISQRSPLKFEALARRAVDPRDSFRMVVKVWYNVETAVPQAS